MKTINGIDFVARGGVLFTFCTAVAIGVRADTGGYSLAQVNGHLLLRNPVSSTFPLGTSTASVQAGIQIAGIPGGTSVGGVGFGPSWTGTLGANGTTITTDPSSPPGVASTAASLNYYPNGFARSGEKGGTIVIPTAGYFSVTKNSNAASVNLSNTLGNTTATASGRWLFISGLFYNEWDGVEYADISLINKDGPQIPENTRAASDVSDPTFLYVPNNNDTLSFEVDATGLDIEINPLDGVVASAYYNLNITLGSGEVPGENIISSFPISSGNFFNTPGIYTPADTVFDYTNDTLPAGVYWLTTDLDIGVQVTPVPEPSTVWSVVGLGGILVGVGLKRKSARPSIRHY